MKIVILSVAQYIRKVNFFIGLRYVSYMLKGQKPKTKTNVEDLRFQNAIQGGAYVFGQFCKAV